jgi:transcriptional regulator with XRE-family HTH domain
MKETFGQRLRRTRLDARLSQAELSSRVGISKPTLSRYENDHVLPALPTLKRLAAGLGITVGTLAGNGSELAEYLIESLRDRGVEISSTADIDRQVDSMARATRGRSTAAKRSRRAQ